MEGREYSAQNHHLQELGQSDFEIANGEPDIRGWHIIDGQGNRIGQVKELLCDVQARKVRYLVVDLRSNALNLEPKDILVPNALAELREQDHLLVLASLAPEQVQALPAYDRRYLSQEMETHTYRVLAGDYRPRPSAGLQEEPMPATVFYQRPLPAVHGNSQEQLPGQLLSAGPQAQNVIGLFSDAASAQRVTQELIRQGFQPGAIKTAMRPAPGTPETEKDFERFFRSLFEQPEAAEQHLRHISGATWAVVVHVYSQEKADLAAHLLHSHKTSELDSRVEQESPASVEPSYPSRMKPEHEPPNPGHYPGGNMEITAERPQAPQENSPFGEQEKPTPPAPFPGGLPAPDTRWGSFQEGTMELKEFMEAPVVSTQPHVVEEITIGKEIVEHEETIRETVKNTEINIERRPADPSTPA